jgi:hypothetical protein
MRLYHFSEQADIARFVPHRAPASILDEKLVWTIDEWHAPMCFMSGNSACDVETGHRLEPGFLWHAAAQRGGVCGDLRSIALRNRVQAFAFRLWIRA